ncbi:hypothetical protein D3874_22575 [Oleomonas cavernae]|uniref:DUF4386 domain-containing protein n=1 Tax=Oleomonas cavernae TaxID=2320859 RepID=A0A418WHA0_9PROT|nr:hypothetical protein D3874_22575 [Oleomonas cavernae]
MKYQLISAWCGPAFVVLFVLFWMHIGGNFPGPSPAFDTAQLTSRYLDNLDDMRLGFVVSLVVITLYMPWTALLSAQMARIEGRYPVLAFLQLIGGGLTVMVVSFSAFFWVAALFRPDRDPALFQLLNDLGWLCIETQYACTTLQMAAAALAGLSDRSKVPLFPRWMCFLTIWCGLSFIPASLTGYFKTGPFAWDGMLSFYIPYACWLVWFSAASYFMIREVHRRMHAADLAAPAGSMAYGA